MALSEKIGLVLLVVMMIALVVVTGPAGLGAVAGAVLFVGMVRVAAPKR